MVNAKPHHPKVRDILIEFLGIAGDSTLMGAEDRACEQLDKLYGELFLERFSHEIDKWFTGALTSSVISVMEAARKAAAI